jgi:hypothetical protein
MRCRCTKLSRCFAWLQALVDRDVRFQIKSGSRKRSATQSNRFYGHLGRPNQPHALEVRQFQPLTCAAPTSTSFAQIVSGRNDRGPRMLSELVTSGLLCFNSWLRGPVAQRLEQGTHNSRPSFCAGFHRLAHRCRRKALRESSIRSALRRIAQFCSKLFPDRRTDRRKMGARCKRTKKNSFNPSAPTPRRR